MTAKALSGKRVLLTRSREDSHATAALLRERGAEPVVLPMIEIHPPADPTPLVRAVSRLRYDYDWVAFTSGNGVHRMWSAITAQGLDARAFGDVKLAAVGPGTGQALEAHGLRADVVAKEFRGEGLADAMLHAIQGRPARVLIARAMNARDVLPDALRGAGCSVDVVAAYATRPASSERVAELVAMLAPPAGRSGVDAATFASSSAIDNICDLLGPRAAELLAHVKVASIGPLTTATAERRGVRVDATATEFTVAGLVEALEAVFRSGSFRDG